MEFSEKQWHGLCAHATDRKLKSSVRRFLSWPPNCSLASSGTSTADSLPPSLSATTSEKGEDIAVKDGASTTDGLSAVSHAQVLGKLSNTVSIDYVIEAEDVLEITVWRNQDLSKVVQVRPDGKFSMPVIRDVTAVGKTTSQLDDELTMRLREYVQNPVVAISVRDVNSYNIFLLGEVVRPGKYPLKSKTTLLHRLRGNQIINDSVVEFG
jgi:protein involved in polysaccharide export with SLBB domain